MQNFRYYEKIFSCYINYDIVCCCLCTAKSRNIIILMLDAFAKYLAKNKLTPAQI